VFDYFITDENGDVSFSFETDSSYHVLWKTTQRTRTASDGPIKTATFDPDLHFHLPTIQITEMQPSVFLVNGNDYLLVEFSRISVRILLLNCISPKNHSMEAAANTPEAGPPP
jgi:hypothetical protein